jgi:glyoxylase-like metal-dependent hydrolase (beta-lactamase superfamily II)
VKKYNTSGGIVIQEVVAGRSNVFLVSKGNHHLLFDTSTKKYRNRLINNLDEMGISSIDILVLSHSHFDHVGSAAIIRQRYQAKVMIHEKEAAYLRQGYCPPPPGTMLFSRLLIDLFADKLDSWFHYDPCKPDIQVDDSYDFNIVGLNARLIHTPGHSPGMTSMIVDNEIALVGDAIFGIFPGSVFPPFAEDEPLLVESWKRLLDTGCRIYLPAHGRSVSRELLENCYLKKTKSR